MFCRLLVIGTLLWASAVSSPSAVQHVEYHPTDSVHIQYHQPPKCPHPFGNFPDFNDCTRYYDCLSGNPQPRKCAPNQSFDKIERKCMAKNKAVCADQTDIVEPNVRCPNAWISFAYPKDCSKYYGCWEHSPDIRTCNNKQLFDEMVKVCMPQKQANCGFRYNPYAPTTPPITTTEKIQETSPPTTEIPKTSPEPTTEEVTVEKTDPTTVEPTTVTEEFITTEKVTSEEIPLETTVETKESSTENIPTTEQIKECHSGDQTCILDKDGDVLRCPSPNGLFKHPKDPHQFIHCSHNVIYVKDCPPTLVFIESKKSCSWDTKKI